MTHPAIERFERAVRDHAFRGTQSPDSWRTIDTDFESAKVELETLVQKRKPQP